MQNPTPTLNHPLLGADLATLVRLFSGHRLPPRVWPKVALFIAAAAARAPLSALERSYARRAGSRLELAPPPVFILGHWRSGTTHLFNLLSRDPRFAWPDPIATGMPWNFLLLGRWLRPLLNQALPESRLIDNVAVNPDSPQEDEIALASMQTLSYYHGLYFPAEFVRHFESGLFPEPDSTDAKLLARRRKRFEQYCRKLRIQGPGDTLLVKNPAWTGQVRWLLDCFPNARFVHIHRNPWVVFESTRNFYRKLLPAYALQAYDARAVEPMILTGFSRMMERMYSDTSTLPAQQFVELSYDALESKPLACLERIYRQLELPGFEAQRPRLKQYLAGIRGYRKNPHRFDPEVVARVERAWGPWIRRWGYEPPSADAAPDSGAGTADGPGAA